MRYWFAYKKRWNFRFLVFCRHLFSSFLNHFLSLEKLISSSSLLDFKLSIIILYLKCYFDFEKKERLRNDASVSSFLDNICSEAYFLKFFPRIYIFILELLGNSPPNLFIIILIILGETFLSFIYILH